MEDERVTDYDKDELISILQDNRYHSPEDSESGGEPGNRSINVYNLSWRSDEVSYFINLFSKKALTKISSIAERVAPILGQPCVLATICSTNKDQKL
jgi:hypothetical protein